VFQKQKRLKNPELLKEIKSKRCEVCGEPPPSDPHHIKSRGAGGDDIPDNLLALCRDHHTEIHMIGISRFMNKYPHVGLKKSH